MISIIKILVLCCYLNSLTSCEFITLHTSPPPEQSCSKTSAVCKLDAKKLNASFKPGAIGPPGLKGDKGETGMKGPPGEDGLNGANGAAGSKGDRGEPGYYGLSGLTGIKGSKGERGLKGQSGPRGKKGEMGTAGLKGFQGNVGNPGISGSCIECPYTDEVSAKTDEGDAFDWGDIQKPASKTCKDAPDDVRDNVNARYYLYMESLEVKCDFITDMTCIDYEDKPQMNGTYYNRSRPFWLSDMVPFKTIYNLEYDTMNWLQQESYKANLTIRYHCLNSKPIARDQSDSMTLLTWNDLSIGHEPATTSLIHYTVLEDGCSTAPIDTWSYTDIQLVSPIAQRLPIIDFRIKDVGKENQALKIEIKQLCFG